jgi:TPR repeat protein
MPRLLFTGDAHDSGRFLTALCQEDAVSQCRGCGRERSSTARHPTVAQYWLGHMTELGLGVSPDLPKAIARYKKAAARGVVAAESRLGEAYLRGDVALPDFGQAKAYLERAARRGDARAAMLLGHMYRIGLGVGADPKKAYAWSEVATLEGSPFARGERDRSLNDLTGGDQQAAVAREREILDAIKRQTATAKPAASQP